jgi:hypothetical protein
MPIVSPTAAHGLQLMCVMVYSHDSSHCTLQCGNDGLAHVVAGWLTQSGSGFVQFSGTVVHVGNSHPASGN